MDKPFIFQSGNNYNDISVADMINNILTNVRCEAHTRETIIMIKRISERENNESIITMHF